jgi:hypothetical protein
MIFADKTITCNLSKISDLVRFDRGTLLERVRYHRRARAQQRQPRCDRKEQDSRSVKFSLHYPQGIDARAADCQKRDSQTEEEKTEAEGDSMR